jgi:hypothetical protein
MKPRLAGISQNNLSFSDFFSVHRVFFPVRAGTGYMVYPFLTAIGFFIAGKRKNHHQPECTMTRICPQCSSPNEDNKKFCTNCGSAIATQPAPSGTLMAKDPIPARIPVAGTDTGTRNLKILTGAMVLIIFIVTVLFIIPAWGKLGNPQQSGASVTPNVPSPVITSTILVETPSPSPTTITVTRQTIAETSRTTEVPRTNPIVTEAAVCASDRRPCNNTCVDLMSDISNCGACSYSCGSGQFCQQGTCRKTCNTDQTSCPDGCFNISSDKDHCGSCGNTCPAGLTCSNNVCALPPKTTPTPYTG